MGVEIRLVKWEDRWFKLTVSSEWDNSLFLFIYFFKEANSDEHIIFSLYHYNYSMFDKSAVVIKV